MSAALILAIGCATPTQQTKPQTVAFVEADFDKFAGTGTATVQGSAFLKTRSGDVKVGAGSTIELVPATPYTIERFGAPAGTSWEPRDPRLAKHLRTTLGDAQGAFEFKNIPAGDYFLAAIIQWEYVDGGNTRQTGGQPITRFSIAAGETKKIVLTR